MAEHVNCEAEKGKVLQIQQVAGLPLPKCVWPLGGEGQWWACA
jgi:hypothetical protein